MPSISSRTFCHARARGRNRETAGHKERERQREKERKRLDRLMNVSKKSKTRRVVPVRTTVVSNGNAERCIYIREALENPTQNVLF